MCSVAKFVNVTCVLQKDDPTQTQTHAVTPAMEISGGQGANGPHLFGLGPNFLDMGATVAPILWSQNASNVGFPEKKTKFLLRLRRSHTLSTKIFNQRGKKFKVCKFC